METAPPGDREAVLQEAVLPAERMGIRHAPAGLNEPPCRLLLSLPQQGPVFAQLRHTFAALQALSAGDPGNWVVVNGKLARINTQDSWMAQQLLRMVAVGTEVLGARDKLTSTATPSPRLGMATAWQGPDLPLRFGVAAKGMSRDVMYRRSEFKPLSICRLLWPLPVSPFKTCCGHSLPRL